MSKTDDLIAEIKADRCTLVQNIVERKKEVDIAEGDLRKAECELTNFDDRNAKAIEKSGIVGANVVGGDDGL